MGLSKDLRAQLENDAREIPKDYQVPPADGTASKPKSAPVSPSNSNTALAQEIQRLEKDLGQIVPDRRGTLALSFSEAIELAILNNLRTLTAVEKLQEARGDFRKSLSGLLPNVSAKVIQTRRTSNFVAEGIDPSALPPGFPTGVYGPYNNFDARVTLLQNIFDWAAIGEFQTGKSIVRLSKLQVVLSREVISKRAGLAYVNALKTQAEAEAAQADYKLSKTLYDLTNVAFQTGVATGLDRIRAQSNMVKNKTRLIRAQAQANVAILQLQEILLLPMGKNLQLTSKLKPSAPPPPPVNQAVEQAETNRPDVKIVKEEIKMRTYQHRAAVGKQVPSLVFGANYGGSGITPAEGTAGTYQFGGQLSIPIFDGGLTLGDIKVAKSKKRQAQLALGQLTQQVNEEVRVALEKMRSSQQEIVAAAEDLKLTKMEVDLAQERFFTGVGDNLELVKAQTSLADARSTYVEALAQFNSARIDLATALGKMEGFEL